MAIRPALPVLVATLSRSFGPRNRRSERGRRFDGRGLSASSFSVLAPALGPAVAPVVPVAAADPA